MCSSFDVSGYPTILYLPARTGSASAAKAAALRFNGQRSREGIRDYVLRMTRPHPLLLLHRGGAVAGTRSGALPAAVAAQTAAARFEAGLTDTAAATFDVKQLIAALGHEGVSFALLLPNTGGGSDGPLLQALDLSSPTAAARSGAHPLVSATVAAAETLRPEMGIMAVAAPDASASPALSAALKAVFARQALPAGSPGALPAGEPLLVQLQNGEPRVEVARVACDGTSASASDSDGAAALAGLPDAEEIGIHVVARVPCDPATGTPLAGGASGSAAGKALGEALVGWVRTHRFPAVTALTAQNFAALAHNPGTHLAIAVVNETEIEAYKAAQAALAAAAASGKKASKKAAKAAGLPPRSVLFMASFAKLAARGSTGLTTAVRDRFVFGWLDVSVHAETFLSQFNISPADAPQLLVLDAPGKRYWHDASVFEYEAQEQQLENIVAGIAPVHRQGILAVPQRFVNRIGLVPAVALAAVAVAAVCWIVWRLVIKELFSSGDSKAAGAAVDADSPRSDVDGGAVKGPAAAAGRGGRSAVPAGGSSGRAPSPSRNGPRPAVPAGSAPAGLGRSESDMDVDDDGEAFQRAEGHDDNVDGSDVDDSDEDRARASGVRRPGSGTQRRAQALARKRAAAAAAAAGRDDEADDAVEGSAAPLARNASRRRVDED